VKVTASASVSASASATTSKVMPANYMGAANGLSGVYAGGMGLVVMVAAALL